MTGFLFLVLAGNGVFRPIRIDTGHFCKCQEFCAWVKVNAHQC